MPAYRGFKWDSGELSIRPKGIRRILRFLWFQTGSTPYIRVSLKRTGEGEWPAVCRIRASHSPDPEERVVPIIGVGEKKVFDVPLNLIISPGDHWYVVQLRKEPPSKGHDMVVIGGGQEGKFFFEAVRQEIVTMWVLGILMAMAAATVGGIAAGLVTTRLVGNG